MPDSYKEHEYSSTGKVLDGQAHQELTMLTMKKQVEQSKEEELPNELRWKVVAIFLLMDSADYLSRGEIF